MRHRPRRYDVFRFAQNDVVPLRVTMMRCLPQCAVRHTSLGEAVIIGGAQHHLPKANIIEKRPSHLWPGLFSGSGTRVRLCAESMFKTFRTYYVKLISPHDAGYRRGGMRTQFLADGKKLGSGRSSTIKRKKTPQGCLLSFGKRLRKRYFLRTSTRIWTQGKLFEKLFIFSFAF